MAYYNNAGPNDGFGGGYGAPPPQQQQPGYPPSQGQAYQQPPYPPQQGQYPPQQGYPPQPQQQQGGGYGSYTPMGTHDQPLIASESHAAMRIEQVKDLPKRDVYDHHRFDIDTLQDIDGLKEMKQSWQFRLETALACWVLFNAVSTIMIILTNFRRSIPPAIKEEYGEQNFEVFLGFITYFPLVYFMLAFLLFNNFYSEVTFYMYLRRGAIVDFPPSAAVSALVKSLMPLLFMITTLAYMVTVIAAFIKFQASFGVILIFFNNVMVGIGMSWYRQQSIEGRFVSISNFIQSFPDRDGQYGNMDEQSLHHASMYLQKLTLTECHKPSYSPYMRLFYWQNKNYGQCSKIWHHIMLLVIIGSMAGACVAYFVILRGLDTQSIWKNEINPCINVCTAMYSNHSTSGFTSATCNECVCRCLDALQQRDDDIIDACGDYFWDFQCNTVANRCPSSSSCSAFWSA